MERFMPDVSRHRDHLLSENEAALRLGVSPRTMQRFRTEGGGPAYVRIGLRRVAYSPAALSAFEAGRTHKSLAAELSRTAA